MTLPPVSGAIAVNKGIGYLLQAYPFHFEVSGYASLLFRKI
jgi:hypothetical protein